MTAVADVPAIVRDSEYPFRNRRNLRDWCDLVLFDPGDSPAPGVDYSRWSLDAAVDRASDLAPGSVVYVKSDGLGCFFDTVFPRIVGPIVLVTAGMVDPTPGAYRHRLSDPKIYRWFGQNCDLEAAHPKFHPIILGLTNPRFAHGDQPALARVRERMPPVEAKPLQAYANFHFTISHDDRRSAVKATRGRPWVWYEPDRLPAAEAWRRHASFAFVLSPRGAGLDSHRTWEALLLRSIPIVRSSTLDPLLRAFPIVIVESWEEVTPVAMDAWRRDLQGRFDDHMLERLSARYWHDAIRRAASDALAGTAR